jgi:hypothetical protein
MSLGVAFLFTMLEACPLLSIILCLADNYHIF